MWVWVFRVYGLGPTKSVQVFREKVWVGSVRIYGFHFRLTVFIDAARDLEAFVVVPDVDGLIRRLLSALPIIETQSPPCRIIHPPQ